MYSNKTHDVTTTAADADMISELSDDVLLHILRFLPSARDVARASVLSKRWRRLWTLAPALRFAVGPGSFADDGKDQEKHVVARGDAARRLIAGVDATLARRADEGNDVDVMEIAFVYSSKDNSACSWGTGRRYYFHDHHHEADITLSRVDEWLRFAERHVKGSFTLEVPLVAPVAAAVAVAEAAGRGEARSQANTATAVTDEGEVAQADEEEEEKIDEIEAVAASVAATDEVVVVELPRSTRAEVMSLTLGYGTASVPVAVVAGAFHALTELTLQHAIIDGGGGGSNLRLSHLLSSSCCPRLRRLSLRHVAGVATLRLDAAATLEELRLVHLPDLQWLDVDAPGLRLLRVGDCSCLPYTDSSAMRISAPSLEVFSCESLVDPERLEFNGAAAVRHIKKLRLMSFDGGDDEEEEEEEEYNANAAAVWLLKNCNAVDHLGVELNIHVDEGYEDIIKDVPQLPSVTSLTIKASSIFDGHAVGASLAKFIAKCNNIEYLHIDFFGWYDLYCSEPGCLCHQPENWEDQIISLENLRVVDIHNFAPLDDKINLVQLLFASSPTLDTMTVELDHSYLFHCREEGKESQFDMPCYQGYWDPCAWEFGVHRFNDGTKFKWKRERHIKE